MPVRVRFSVPIAAMGPARLRGRVMDEASLTRHLGRDPGLR